MALALRPAIPIDGPELGRICFEAFRSIAERHGYRLDIPSVDAGVGLLSYLTGHPGVYGVVAESDGRIVGSNFMDERSAILAFWYRPGARCSAGVWSTGFG